MTGRDLPLSFSLACYLSALPTVAADSETSAEAVTGLTNTGIGMLIIAVAVALLTTLLIRASASHLARTIMSRLARRRIRRILTTKSGRVMEDFILPGAYGGLTNIDFAMLSSGGILCIQTKHFDGVIAGNPDEPQWTNVDGMQQRKFLNPMIQNAGRTKALQEIVPNIPVSGLVIFTGSVRFDSKVADNVIRTKDLAQYIANPAFETDYRSDLDTAWSTLQSAALTDEETRKDFRAQLSFS